MAPQSPAYNLDGVLVISGALNRAAMDTAIRGLIARHEVLRTTFVTDDGLEPYQLVGAVPRDGVELVDIESLSPESPESLKSPESAAARIAGECADRPFDLAAEAPCRFTLIRLDRQTHWLVIVVHHIVADNWSQSILVNDLAELYEAAVAGVQAGSRRCRSSLRITPSGSALNARPNSWMSSSSTGRPA